MLTLFKRIIKSGWQSFKRQGNLSFANCLILVIAISLISSLFLFHKILNSLVLELKEKADVSVYLKETSSEEDISDLRSRLSELPGVREIEYISREEALDRFIEQHKDEKSLMESLIEVGTNPFLASFNIKASSSQEYEKIVEFLNQNLFQNVIEKIDYYKRKGVIEKIFSISHFVERTGLVIFLVLGLISILITFNTIRLAIYTQKEEIGIMRLVGASNWFIRSPFLTQGLICAFLAFLVSFLMTGACVYFLSPRVEGLISVGLVDYFKNYFWEIIRIQIISSVSLGTIPSFIAARKYLRT